MKNVLIGLLLLSAPVSSAFANAFSNPDLGINWNIGSAPSPTPQDIRENRTPTVTETPAATTEDDVTAAPAQKEREPKVAVGQPDHNVPTSPNAAPTAQPVPK